MAAVDANSNGRDSDDYEGERNMRTGLMNRIFLLFSLAFVMMLILPAAGFALETAPGETSSPAPTIQSDKEDYPPGGAVVLTGQNWQPGESVHVNVNDTYGASWSRNVDVSANANGEITDTFNLPDWFVSDYDVTATGAQSGTVRTTFTDSPNPNTLTVSPSSAQVTQGNSVNYSATVGYGGNTTAPSCTISLSASGLPTGASASFNPSSRTSTSTADFNSVLTVSTTNATPTGTHTFTVQMTRGAGCQGNGNLTKQVTLVVNSGNRAPVANAQSVTTNEDVAKPITLTGTDADGNSLTYTIVSGPANGALSGTGANRTYTPNPNYNGSDSFTFKVNDGTTDSNTATVSISVTAVNDAPAAVNNSYSTAEDTTLTVAAPGVLSNDTDVEGDTLTVTNNTSPARGSVTLNPNGSFTYTPNANYNGPDSFDYTVSDGKGGTATATVNVTVSAVNDAPTANAQSVTTNEDVAKAITLVGNDVEGSSLTYTIVSGPSHGTLSGSGVNQTYTPAANYNGPDSFTFKVNDGSVDSSAATVSIDVTAVNDPPNVGNITGDAAASEGQTKTYTVTGSDPDGDTLTYAWTVKSGAATITGGAATDTATVNFLDGPDNVNLQVVVSDGQGGQVTKNLDSNPIDVSNVAPSIALSGATTADEGQTKTYTYTVSDPGNDTYTATEACGTGGTKTDTAAANSFDCTFPDGPATTDVTVKVTDSDGATDTDNQVVTVTVSNVAPTVTLSGDATADEGQTKTYTYTVSDPGDDSNPTITESCGANGTKTDTAASNSFECTFPDGPASSTVSVSANDGNDTGSKSIDVTVANVKPSIALSGPALADEGQTKTYTYTVSDPGNDTYTATEACGTGGTKTDTAAANSFDCTFPDGPATTDVTVKVTDSDGATDTDNQVVTVTVSNVPPVVTAAANQSASEGTSTNFNLGSFTDPGDDASWEVSVDWGDNSAPTTFQVNAAGSLGSQSHTYADEGTGTYTVTVKVAEAGSGDTPSDTKTFEVAVANVNPTIGPLTVTGNSGTACIGSTNVVKLSFSITDPGSTDTHSGTINWGDGTTTPFNGSSVTEAQHSYSAGTYNITVNASDDDGGNASPKTTAGSSQQVSLRYNVSQLLEPVNPAGMTMSVFKHGSTVPLKVIITDCNNQPVNGLVPKISFTKVNPATPVVGVNEGFSTQPNDTNYLMRDAGNGHYIYNLNTRSLADGDATYNATITDSKATSTAPATYGPKTSQNFGLRSK